MDNPKPDPAGNPGPRTARSQRERELERKRERGEASCAECRRLKLKCDKKVPCSSCIRRGCSSICPNGSLATGQGTRYVLANTDKLHNKLLEMSRRIRQLEDALQIAQLSITTCPHPLLSDDLLGIKTGVDVVEEVEKDAFDEMLPNIGTLTITEHGETRFVGRTGAEGIMETVMRDLTIENRTQMLSMLPDEVAFLTEAFPFAPVNLPKRKILQLISERLPSYERATSLVEAYLAHLSCFFRPVERVQIMEELLPRYYKHRDEAFAEDEKGVTVHELALLLAVLASGAAGDLTQEARNDEGELYRHLARCALSLHNIFEGTSACTVQALSLVGAYDFFSASAQTLEATWKIQSLALCLASSIGLHWDPSSWNIGAKYAQRRRSIFWELYTLDNWKSLGSGRPPIFRLHEVDCRYPEDPEAIIGKDGQTLHGFFHWKHDYAKQVVAVVAAKLCTVRPMKYSEIMELDRKVREYPGFPTEYLEKLNSGESPDIFQALTITLYREISLIFIHRNFFARALRENPTNPIRSRFGPSFLAAYASAITMLRAMRRNFEPCRRVLLRIWPFWAHALASGVIVGSVAARDTSELARTALKDLELAISLFVNAANHPVSKNGLPILLRLRDKARSNFEEGDGPLTMINAPQSEPAPSSAGTVKVKVEPIDEALSMLGGETKLVKKLRKKPFGSSSPCGSPSSTSANTSPTPPDSTNVAIRNAPTDTQELLQSLGVVPPPGGANAMGSLGLESGDVYTWLCGQAVNRASEGGNHNQLSFANTLAAASGAGAGAGSGAPGGDAAAASQTRTECNALPGQQQQQQQPFQQGPGDADGLAFWGMQNAFNFQGTGTAGTTSEPQFVQRGFESLDMLSGQNSAASNPAFPLSMTPLVDNPFGFDFDVEGMAMHADPGAYSQLGSGDDTIEDAWRTIMEDPRFASTEPSSLFPYPI